MRPQTIEKGKRAEALINGGMNKTDALAQVRISGPSYLKYAQLNRVRKYSKKQTVQMTVNLNPAYSNELALVENLLMTATLMLQNLKGTTHAN